MGDVEVDGGVALVGQAVRRARSAAGLSMRALALRSGVSQPFLSQLERGQVAPSLATLYRLAAALGVPAAQLVPQAPAAVAHGEVVVARRGDGRTLPVSEHPASALGRVLVSGAGRQVEVIEYVLSPGEDLDAWFEHPGANIMRVESGRVRVDLRGHPPVELAAGDTLYHPGLVANRWTLLGDTPAVVFLVVTTPPPS